MRGHGWLGWVTNEMKTTYLREPRARRFEMVGLNHGVDRRRLPWLRKTRGRYLAEMQETYSPNHGPVANEV